MSVIAGLSGGGCRGGAPSSLLYLEVTDFFIEVKCLDRLYLGHLLNPWNWASICCVVYRGAKIRSYLKSHNKLSQRSETVFSSLFILIFLLIF